MSNAEIMASRAHDLRVELIQELHGVEKHFLSIAAILTEVHDKSLWKFGWDGFDEWLADPDIPIKRRTAYRLMRAFRMFVQKLQVPEDRLLEIGTTKLDIIADVVEGDPEGWLTKGKALSKSDLKTEVRIAQGRPILPPLRAKSLPIPPSPALSADQYVEWVKQQPCLACGERGVDPHHFPFTRGSGQGKEWWVIPLCRRCHELFHTNPMKHMWDWRCKWGPYFYGFAAKDDDN